jgi:phage-related protein
MNSSRLFGQYHVMPTASCIQDASSLFPKFHDYQLARRQALKLAFWPKAGPEDKRNQVLDLDWEWIRGMGAGMKVGELRISDVIGGHDNLRIIFYVSPVKRKEDLLPRIWTLSILQKKSKRFTTRDIKTFKGRLKILKFRQYS